MTMVNNRGRDVKEDSKEKTEEVEEVKEEKSKHPAPKKKSILSLSGLIIAVLGALGLVGAILLDPLMNMTDSNHSADINIGGTQMMAVLAAAMVVIVGMVITIIMRSKSAKG